MSDTDLRKKLTPEQYHVTRENGTEPPSTMLTGTTTNPAFTST